MRDFAVFFVGRALCPIQFGSCCTAAVYVPSTVKQFFYGRNNDILSSFFIVLLYKLLVVHVPLSYTVLNLNFPATMRHLAFIPTTFSLIALILNWSIARKRRLYVEPSTRLEGRKKSSKKVEKRRTLVLYLSEEEKFTFELNVSASHLTSIP